MSSSSILYAMQIASAVAQLAIIVLWVWIAIILFRQRTRGAWTVMIGTVLSVGHTIFTSIGRPLLRSVMSFDSQSYYLLMTTLGNVSKLLVVGGLLMHLLQRKSESDRIAELEAIIRDRDGTA